MAKCKAIEKMFEKDGEKYPTLELREDGKHFGFTFGIHKARMFIENIAAIQAFVEKHKEVRPDA